jgi:hypothetical protein
MRLLLGGGGRQPFSWKQSQTTTEVVALGWLSAGVRGCSRGLAVRLCESLLHAVGGIPHQVRDDVRVRVHGQIDLRVPELLHHGPHACALCEQQRRCAVPEIVEGQETNAGLLEPVLKAVRDR